MKTDFTPQRWKGLSVATQASAGQVKSASDLRVQILNIAAHVWTDLSEVTRASARHVKNDPNLRVQTLVRAARYLLWARLAQRAVARSHPSLSGLEIEGEVESQLRECGPLTTGRNLRARRRLRRARRG